MVWSSIANIFSQRKNLLSGFEDHVEFPITVDNCAGRKEGTGRKLGDGNLYPPVWTSYRGRLIQAADQ